ncbi:MAG TPA: nuclear transport factor 2 family protein [Thauera sp.]|mgnify:FL=1|nr:nuclear transport factor 2 family protein [Thauera sp.]HRA81843.1 nuclear transport factor 2 family protein [Thauera sp.]
METDTPQKMRRIVQDIIDGLNAGDAERILRHYAEDATVEDPVGSEPVRGRTAIAEFYQRAVAIRARIELVTPIRASHGLAAAMAFNVRVDTPQGEMCIAVIEVLEFDATLKVTSMRAYWAPDDVLSVAPVGAGT